MGAGQVLKVGQFADHGTAQNWDKLMWRRVPFLKVAVHKQIFDQRIAGLLVLQGGQSYDSIEKCFFLYNLMLKLYIRTFTSHKETFFYQ